MMSNEMQYSYGIVPLSKLGGTEWNILLIQHKSDGYWGFPKGKPEKGESFKETAMRELFEETHLEIVRFISEEQFSEQYHFIWRGKQINKQVSFLAAEVKGELILQPEEVCAAQWVPLLKADQYLTYASAKIIWKKTLQLLQD